MKKLIILLAVVFTFHFSQAQFLSVGLRGGVSSSAVQVSQTFPVAGTNIKYTDGDKVLGWHAGLFGRVGISSLYVQPEILIAQSGGGINIDSAGTITKGELKFSNLSVPVMVGYKFGEVLRVNAGPVLNILLSNNVKGDIRNWQQTYKSGTIGFQAGVGLDISKLLIDLKYEGSLSKLGDQITIPGTTQSFDTDTRTSQIIVSIGYRLF
jgi:hypothetical protein